MSDMFKYPFQPIPWSATPQDFAKAVADVPYLGIYTQETTQRYVLGTRYTTWDGRLFVYSKSVGSCLSGQGAEFTYTGYTAYTAFAVAAAAGDTSVTVPAATHAALTEDELAGGYICIFTNDVTNSVQFRGIVGNDAAVADAAFIVYFDAPLNTAVTITTSACETYQNPYAALRTGTSASLPKAGVPAVYVTATGKYFWCQREGMCWISPQSTVNNNEGIGCMWRHDGSIEALTTAVGGTTPDADTTQYAGTVISGSQSGVGPLFDLRG